MILTPPSPTNTYTFHRASTAMYHPERKPPHSQRTVDGRTEYPSWSWTWRQLSDVRDLRGLFSLDHDRRVPSPWLPLNVQLSGARAICGRRDAAGAIALESAKLGPCAHL